MLKTKKKGEQMRHLTGLARKFLAAVGLFALICIILGFVSNIGTWLLFAFGSRIFIVVTTLATGLPWLILTILFAFRSFRQPLYYYEKMLGRRVESSRMVMWLTSGTGLIVSVLILTTNFLKPSANLLDLAAISVFAACLFYDLTRLTNQRISGNSLS